jgi:hypothetical protein
MAVTVTCRADSSWFKSAPPPPVARAQRFSAAFRGWFALQGNVTDGLPKNCKWKRSNVTRCLFPQYFADETETRLWPLQSLYDPLQIWNDFPKVKK